MSLRIGLGDTFYGLNYNFGGSLCISDNSLILATILDPRTLQYDGYVAIQRETGNVSAEFKKSRLKGARPGVATVKSITVNGKAKTASLVQVLINVDGQVDSFNYSISVEENELASSVASKILTTLNNDNDLKNLLDIKASSVSDETVVLTSKNVNANFFVSATHNDSSTDSVRVPIATATTTIEAPKSALTQLSLPTLSFSNEIEVLSSVGFEEGMDIMIGSFKRTIDSITSATTIKLVEPMSALNVPAGIDVYTVPVLKVDQITNFKIGDYVYIKDADGTSNGLFVITEILPSLEITVNKPLLSNILIGSKVETREKTQQYQITSVITEMEGVKPITASEPETTVTCFDYYDNGTSGIFYACREGLKDLFILDPLNSSTRPSGMPPFSEVSGNIRDIAIMDERFFVLDDLNKVYMYHYEAAKASWNSECIYEINPAHKVKSMTGSSHVLRDKFYFDQLKTTPPTQEEKEKANAQTVFVNRLYFLIENNKVLVLDLNLMRMIEQTAIISDVEVNCIDFYRTYQVFAKNPTIDKSFLEDRNGLSVNQSTDFSDSGFIFSLASGIINDESICRWQYNLYNKYVPTNIFILSGQKSITPGGSIFLLARGLSDQGEIISDLPIKFSVAGNAGGSIPAGAGDDYRHPISRDGWVAGQYKADPNPPVGASDIITATMIT